jgi:hypothetical protein
VTDSDLTVVVHNPTGWASPVGIPQDLIEEVIDQMGAAPSADTVDGPADLVEVLAAAIADAATAAPVMPMTEDELIEAVEAGHLPEDTTFDDIARMIDRHTANAVLTALAEHGWGDVAALREERNSNAREWAAAVLEAEALREERDRLRALIDRFGTPSPGSLDVGADTMQWTAASIEAMADEWRSERDDLRATLAERTRERDARDDLSNDLHSAGRCGHPGPRCPGCVRDLDAARVERDSEVAGTERYARWLAVANTELNQARAEAEAGLADQRSIFATARKAVDDLTAERDEARAQLAARIAAVKEREAMRPVVEAAVGWYLIQYRPAQLGDAEISMALITAVERYQHPAVMVDDDEALPSMAKEVGRYRLTPVDLAEVRQLNDEMSALRRRAAALEGDAERDYSSLLDVERDHAAALATLTAERDEARAAVRVGICGATTDPVLVLPDDHRPGIGPCDLPAGHVGWHGCDQTPPPGTLGWSSRVSWMDRIPGFHVALKDSPDAPAGPAGSSEPAQQDTDGPQGGGEAEARTGLTAGAGATCDNCGSCVDRGWLVPYDTDPGSLHCHDGCDRYGIKSYPDESEPEAGHALYDGETTLPGRGGSEAGPARHREEGQQATEGRDPGVPLPGVQRMAPDVDALTGLEAAIKAACAAGLDRGWQTREDIARNVRAAAPHIERDALERAADAIEANCAIAHPDDPVKVDCPKFWAIGWLRDRARAADGAVDRG